MKKLQVKGHNIKAPKDGDAGYDLLTPENITIWNGEQKIIDTEVSMVIPDGYVGLVKDKSSMAGKKRIIVTGGVIDSSYRGHIKVVLENIGKHSVEIEKGRAIAQLIIVPVITPEIQYVNELETTWRGERGFGEGTNQ